MVCMFPFPANLAVQSLFQALQVRREKGTGFLSAINKIRWLKTKVKLCETVGWKITKG